MMMNEEFVLFRATPSKGKWLSLISRLLNNDAPRSALGDDNFPKTLDDLCEDAKAALSAEPVVITIDIQKPEDRLILVGDVHGQFRDMQANILSAQKEVAQQGQESDFHLLFLGDYVDRGPHGVEVILLLLALKVEYPNLVYLLRGNHEEAQTCRVYGFLAECRAKLDVESWGKVADVFRHLPLAAAVVCPSGSFFCTHGGLSPHTKQVEALQFLNRTEYPDNYMMDASDAETIDGLLWSDPTESSGYQRNYRGCGFMFGADCTEEFCQLNDFQFICRAHQMVMAGYQWDHGGKLLTLFSAPNYCGVNDNRGAIAILRGKDQIGSSKVKLEFSAFDVAPASPSAIYGVASPQAGAVMDQYFAASPPLHETVAPPVLGESGAATAPSEEAKREE